MKEDLRYLENLIEDITYSSHPSDKELADFIDNKLKSKSKDIVVKHLIHCYKCRKVVDEVIEHKKDYTHKNNLIFNSSLIALIASLIIFVYLPKDIKIGIIDFSKPPIIYKNSNNIKLTNKIIDGDKFLSKLIKSTSFLNIESFEYAKQKEQKENIKEAKEFYKEALKEILEQENNQEILKQKIIIYNRLLQLSNNKKEQKEYRDIIRYNIRVYFLKYGDNL